MNLLILNGPAVLSRYANPRYRGTFRHSPTYFDSLPQDHEVNKLFYWFLEEGGQTGVVHDVITACRFAELANKLSSDVYEVIEVSKDEDYQSKNQFLGFDLSQGFNNSLLWWGLKIQNPTVIMDAQVGEDNT